MSVAIIIEMEWNWIVWFCFFPTVQQAFLVSLSILGPSLFLRIIVLYSGVSTRLLNSTATVLGIFVLWWFYSASLVYFILLCAIVYPLLLMSRQKKGAVVAFACIAFIILCETFVVSKVEWHRVRGSFLVVVMKNISLAFDLDSHRGGKNEKKPPLLLSTPDLLSYTSFCLFPGTSVFGPFLTYSEHIKFLHPAPMSIQWVVRTLTSLVLSYICLGVSVCIMPFLFTEPEYNKSAFRVVHPLAIELPRSMPLIVTQWNLPMHIFLKNYVFKPSKYYLGQFSGILITFIASSMLHGFHLQLTAVLLSLGLYAYIESVLRMKLSRRLNACVLDRPCNEACNHYFKDAWWVGVINIGFTLLNMFHLAYLGVMFGGSTEEQSELEVKGYSLSHTLRQWNHLDFLSHWVAIVSFIFSWCVL